MANFSQSIPLCLICGNSKLQRLERYTAHHLVRCQKCSFVFASRRPSQKELDNVYSRYRRGEIHPTLLTVQKYRNLVKKLIKYRRLDSVLDVACGDGHLLASFKEYGIKTYGTEYDADSAKAATSRGVEMLSGGLEPQLPEGINGFDAITFTEVVEHINNPVDTLAHFFKSLKPGGLLYITTPNFGSIESKLLGPEWGMIMYPEHLCYYTPSTLNLLLKGVGFEKILCSTENISFFRLAQFWQKRFCNISSNFDPEAISSAAQSAFYCNIGLRIVKQFVNKVLAVTGTGSQLLAIYRKPEQLR